MTPVTRTPPLLLLRGSNFPPHPVLYFLSPFVGSSFSSSPASWTDNIKTAEAASEVAPCSLLAGCCFRPALAPFFSSGYSFLLSSCWLLLPQGLVFLLARRSDPDILILWSNKPNLNRFSLTEHFLANKNTRMSSLLHSSCDPAPPHFSKPLFLSLSSLLLSFVSPCRRLLGIITKKDILRHMAQMANQDPESIMFNWSAPSRTAGGEGETTARRRRWCASWTAPISDIRTLFFLVSFQLCRPRTSAPPETYRPWEGKRW